MIDEQDLLSKFNSLSINLISSSPLNTSLDNSSFNTPNVTLIKPNDEMPTTPIFDVKYLNIVPDYDGNPNELHNFIHVTTMLLNQFWNATEPDSFQNYMLTQGIISKLKGRAKEIVSIYGCIDWPTVKDTLIQNFADQRNENSLTRDLVNLRQGPNENPQQFYEKVMGLLNTISNYIELHNENATVKLSKKTFFQQQALTTFLAGLREPLGSTIRAMRPKNLPTAIQYIQEEDNIRYLQKGTSSQQAPTKFALPTPKQFPVLPRPTAPTPPSWQQFGFRQQPPPPSPFLFRPQAPQRPNPPNEQKHFGQPPRFQPNQPAFRQFQPFQPNTWTNKQAPSHLPKPTPMSTTSRPVSQNRPFNQKLQQPPPKFTVEELFNIEQQDEASGYDPTAYENQEYWNYYDTEYQQTLYQQEDQRQEYSYQTEEDENFRENPRTNEET